MSIYYYYYYYRHERTSSKKPCCCDARHILFNKGDENLELPINVTEADSLDNFKGLTSWLTVYWTAAAAAAAINLPIVPLTLFLGLKHSPILFHSCTLLGDSF